jgi:hypothetical protein
MNNKLIVLFVALLILPMAFAVDVVDIFYNWNVGGVSNGPSYDTTFSISEPMMITSINNYHYFNYGALPGTIALRHSDGTVYGPWETNGGTGQGGVPNAYWVAEPNVVIKAGDYTVIDSDPSTWSQNSGSGYEGFSWVQGYASQQVIPEFGIVAAGVALIGALGIFILRRKE